MPQNPNRSDLRRAVPAGPPRDGSVSRLFSAIADRYDLLNTLLSLGLHHRWKRLAVATLDLKAGERVLDVCGGTADLALRAAGALGPAGRTVLLDFNRAMLERGTDKVRRASLTERIAAIQGDAEALCFPAECYDAVVVGFGVRNLSDRIQGLTEMHRVLKPGGRFVCLEFSQPPAGPFRRLYDLYSATLIPLAGRVVAGHREAYRYLTDSIRRFPSPEALAALLGDLGFVRIAYRRLTGGIAVIHSGVKPEPHPGMPRDGGVAPRHKTVDSLPRLG